MLRAILELLFCEQRRWLALEGQCQQRVLKEDFLSDQRGAKRESGGFMLLLVKHGNSLNPGITLWKPSLDGALSIHQASTRFEAACLSSHRR
ncbi:MAG: hypothetical protein ABS69_16410 [Nitrosomonadales bacterium SCN 54-20]|nr:MAG: hypothetical protein ABS69_16410 [Nitrosomonadales bacterium SCN 54-20]